jgi:hypothetical protein
MYQVPPDANVCTSMHGHVPRFVRLLMFMAQIPSHPLCLYVFVPNVTDRHYCSLCPVLCPVKPFDVEQFYTLPLTQRARLYVTAASSAMTPIRSILPAFVRLASCRFPLWQVDASDSENGKL